MSLFNFRTTTAPLFLTSHASPTRIFDDDESNPDTRDFCLLPKEDATESKRSSVPHYSSNFYKGIDAFEDETRVEISLDVPGMLPGDIDLTVEDGIARVSGCRRKLSGDGKTLKKMRYYQAFKLPNDVDTMQIKANLSYGVLTVAAPKLPKPEPKKIVINVPDADSQQDQKQIQEELKEKQEAVLEKKEEPAKKKEEPAKKQTAKGRTGTARASSRHTKKTKDRKIHVETVDEKKQD